MLPAAGGHHFPTVPAGTGVPSLVDYGMGRGVGMAEASVREARELLVPGPAQALAGLLDLPGDGIGEGWALPPLWHWVYLLDRPAQSRLGPEGHPRDGLPQPPAPGLRRMFGGGRVHLDAPLRLGAVATSRVEVIGSREQHGRSGPFTLVTTRNTITQDGRIAVVDEQDILYREPRPLPAPAQPPSGPDAGPGPSADSDAGPADEERREFHVDEVLLFRFSALTYNAHRIHYDVDYCRDVEGFPGLVVHGPLQALLMAELARSCALAESGPPSTVEYRLVAPLILGQGLAVGCRPDAPHSTVTSVRDATGRRTATGHVAFA